MRKACERRLEDLAVKVLVAVGAVAEQERRAGEALRVMVEEEGLTLREAVGWCGGEVSVRTDARCKRVVSDRSEEDDTGDGGGRAGLDMTGLTQHCVSRRVGSSANDRCRGIAMPVRRLDEDGLAAVQAALGGASALAIATRS